MYVRFGSESQKERNNYEDLDVRGYIKMNVRETEGGGMNWIHLAQDRDQWWAPVNILMNLWGQQNVGTFLGS
jgi:hypothetical protein